MPDQPPHSTKRLRALVVDDEIDICRMLSICLTADKHEVTTVTTAAEALAQTSRRSFDLVFLDLRLGTENGLDSIQPLLETNPWLRVIVITAYAAVDTAVEAMKRGASEYLSKPFTPAQVRVIVRKVAEVQSLAQRASVLQETVSSLGPVMDFDTTSAQMRESVELARRAAEGQATIRQARVQLRRLDTWRAVAERPATSSSPKRDLPEHGVRSHPFR